MQLLQVEFQLSPSDRQYF